MVIKAKEIGSFEIVLTKHCFMCVEQTQYVLRWLIQSHLLVCEGIEVSTGACENS